MKNIFESFFFVADFFASVINLFVPPPPHFRCISRMISVMGALLPQPTGRQRSDIIQCSWQLASRAQSQQTEPLIL